MVCFYDCGVVPYERGREGGEGNAKCNEILRAALKERKFSLERDKTGRHVGRAIGVTVTRLEFHSCWFGITVKGQ